MFVFVCAFACLCVCMPVRACAYAFECARACMHPGTYANAINMISKEFILLSSDRAREIWVTVASSASSGIARVVVNNVCRKDKGGGVNACADLSFILQMTRMMPSWGKCACI